MKNSFLEYCKKCVRKEGLHYEKKKDRKEKFTFVFFFFCVCTLLEICLSKGREIRKPFQVVVKEAHLV